MASPCPGLHPDSSGLGQPAPREPAESPNVIDLTEPDPNDDPARAVLPQLTAEEMADPNLEILNYSLGFIILRMGADLEPFRVEEAILRQTSRWFRAELDRKQMAGDHLAIYLPEDSWNCINLYVEWLRSGRLSKPFQHDPYGIANDGKGCVAEGYILGESIEDDSYCDAMIMTMAEAADIQRFPGIRQLCAFYDGLADRSKLHDFLVTVFAERGSVDWISSVPGRLPHQFLEQLSVKLLQHRRPSHVKSFTNLRQIWFKTLP